jgi:hypothetical protein
MSYNLDKSLSWNGLYKYTTDNGAQYLAKISETAKNSGLWTLDFIKVSGDPSPIEVFKILNTLFLASMEFVNQRNINNAYLAISGENDIEIEKKTKAFTRWIEEYWNYEIVDRPEFKISGKKETMVIPTKVIFMKRKPFTPINVVSESNNSFMKFCPNCGNQNNDFQFCSNCGTNLKQA